MDAIDLDQLNRKLQLYIRYVDVLEHLCVLDGALPLDDKNYNISWLKKSGRTWLHEYRVVLERTIRELE